MVTLAKGSPSRRKNRAHQTENATVMLGVKPRLTISTGSQRRADKLAHRPGWWTRLTTGSLLNLEADLRRLDLAGGAITAAKD